MEHTKAYKLAKKYYPTLWGIECNVRFRCLFLPKETTKARSLLSLSLYGEE